MGALEDCCLIVRTGGRLTEGRVAWREGERGRLLPRVVVGSTELGPAHVEVVEVDAERAEALRASGYEVTNIEK